MASVSAALTRRSRFILSSAIAVLVVLFAGVVVAGREPAVRISLDEVRDRVSVASPITIHFDRPVSRQLDFTIEPDVLGNWQFGDRLFDRFFTRTVTLEPDTTLDPDTTYTVTVRGIRNGLRLGGSKDVRSQFTTQRLPAVRSVVASDSSEAIAPTARFLVELDGPNNGLASFDFRFDPAVEFTTEQRPNRMGYVLTPTQPLEQGTRHQLIVTEQPVRTDRQTGEIVHRGEAAVASVTSWDTRQAPGILDVGPTGEGVARDADLLVAFSEPMEAADVATGLRVEPSVDGTWQSEDRQTFRLKPDGLTADTAYTLTVPEGLRTLSGGYIPSDATYTFRTKGAVRLVASTPGIGARGVNPTTAIRLTFDQSVAPESAKGRFAVEPQVPGSLAVAGQTLTYMPSEPLRNDTTYTVTLAAGVVGEEGIPSKEPVEITFTTEPTVVEVSVPFYRQQRKLSCEAAALRMALAGKGVSTTEDAIMAIVGFDPTPHRGNVWGDPHAAFVGDINGRQPTTGYGVYWEPIARAANRFRQARAFTGGTLAAVTAEVAKGNPVIIWGNATTGQRIDWVTPSGKKIVAIDGEHTRVVRGFVGPANNPAKIIVNDPLYGRRVYSASAFDRDWALLGRSGVVVE